ncbi:agamous-like MADS-box protein AGL62 [Humulus lupulus]|uniref:agamous-like MADS-box protein AGL62 n=1 Tax=Humulus lupulus TaxID=3486 RepID=UPI002B4038CD|nr:agamous-like MADS-box protein AGL62 [Humulus lupulus]
MKRGQGRQKIEIKKLQKKSRKQVTFSKRRSGIFNKAGELSLLCGSDIAVIVFSPNGKLFCFGHPSVDNLIHRYLNGISHTATSTNDSEQIAAVDGTIRTYVESLEELEAEKKQVAEARLLSSLLKEEEEEEKDEFRGGGAWWDEAVDWMELEELEQYVDALSEMRRKVCAKVQNLTQPKADDVVLLP